MNTAWKLNGSELRGRSRLERARRHVRAAIPIVLGVVAATLLATASLVISGSGASAASSQTIAAGTSSTNLPTETVWPGAQNPPYICCWGTQGQFVTFSFTVAGGSTNLVLRYGAGNGVASRKIELDGAVTVANQTFPATPTWSTWTTLTLNRALAAGPHTLEIVWDNASGSSQYVNLDNLTVTQLASPPAPVNTVLPAITGTAQQGQTLAASTGTWTNAPTSFTYAWNRCTTSCAPIGVTTSSYTLAAGDVGAKMDVTVVASNASGPGAPATSAQTAVVTATSGGGTQTIAAGKSATNLPTEAVWPGAQNPPYICCWGTQGQFVTFSFTVAGGPTNLVLRYSAGNGVATRKIEVDGAVAVANEAFPATASWSTWTTVALSQTFTAGTHTLEVLWDNASGSSQYLNLDNLAVSQSAPPPAGVVVSVGYADDATGLTPWMGSPNTTYIGETPQCCATHGPDNGSPGFDGGAMEIANTSAVAVTVNAVTVDFGGGSSPSHYDLWGSGVTPHLPQTLAPGTDLVLTATNFNFDTSDLFGEACHTNSGVVPVVHVTLNGSLTDYQDDHQILNSDGSDTGSCPLDVSEQQPFTVVVAGIQPPAVAVNDVPPSVTAAGPATSPSTPTVGRIVSGFAGAWNASPPPTLSVQWTRCDTGGNNCTPITNATSLTYVPTATDVGDTLRLQSTATNPSGHAVLSSAPTTVVQTGPSVAQLGHTLTGGTAEFVDSTAELTWVETATASGTTSDFAFYARGAGNDQVFTPKIYAAVNGAEGALLATGAPVTAPRGTDGRWYVSKLSGLHLTAGTQYVFALDPSGSFNGTYVGAETTGETSFFVDDAPG